MKQKIVIGIMSFVLILFTVLLIVIWKEKDIKQSDYTSTTMPELIDDKIFYNNYGRVLFELGGYGEFYIETEYEDGLIAINGEKESRAYMKSGIYLMFENVTSWFPQNQLFDLNIELYDNSGCVAEQITLKNIYVYDGKINEIQNTDEIECLFILEEGEKYKFDLNQFKNVQWLGVYTNKVQLSCTDLADMSKLVHLTAYGGSIQGNIYDLSQSKSLQGIELYGGGIDIDLNDLVQIKTLKKIVLSLYQENIAGDLESINIDIEVLRISNVNLHGSLESLADNYNLKDLKITGASNITGDLEALKSLSGLESLIINCSRVTGNLESLSQMEKLKYLWINSEQIAGDISALTNNADLRFVDLTSSNFTGYISSFSELTNLTVLGLESDNIFGDIGTLGVLESLKECYIADCPNVSGELTIKNPKEMHED